VPWLKKANMSASVLAPGFRVGKYEVLAHIATGGMGAVYKATDVELGRTVALKILPAHMAHKPAIVERFRREARHAARLSHPHIVTLLECGHDDATDLYYLVMEFIDGVNLENYLARKRRVRPEMARRILIQTTRALNHAYEQGIVHRDIKPSNILLARMGDRLAVKLTDLGLARLENDAEFKVTREGSTVGTIDYMAPEQALDSQSSDVRSDIYSLGCTAYEMLAGKAPFAEGGIGERVYKKLEAPPPEVREINAAVSPAFEAVILKMLAKKPEDRYATPAELLQALKSISAEASEADIEESFEPDTPLPPAPVTPPASNSVSVSSPTPAPQEFTQAASSSRPDLGMAALPSDVLPPELITPDQLKAAAAFHDRATQVLAEGGGDAYARELLANCLKLDPFTPGYRQTLRDLNRKTPKNVLSRWLGSLNVVALKSKLRLARSAGDWRKVLELGEEVLARQPADADTHIQMAEVVEELGLAHLAMWLLQQARQLVPDDTKLLRALAGVFERKQLWKPARLIWEKVRHLDPHDPQAERKINDLSAQDILARGVYRS
jgi:serine/threonine protein kinase